MKNQIERNYLPEITKENSNKELNLSLLTYHNIILSLLRLHCSIFKSLKNVKLGKQAWELLWHKSAASRVEIF